MIYLIGGAPRSGKSILGQQVAVTLKRSWISTDVLQELLRVAKVEGGATAWNATRSAITANAEWFLPYLECFIWSVNSLADSYVIDGVDFLPAQVAQLATRFQLRAVFLGCSQMTLARFDQFPGRSHGYASLPAAMRQQIVQDVGLWSTFIAQEADRFGYPAITGSRPDRWEKRPPVRSGAKDWGRTKLINQSRRGKRQGCWDQSFPGHEKNGSRLSYQTKR